MRRSALGFAPIGSAVIALGLALVPLAEGCTGVVSIGLETSDGGDDSGAVLVLDARAPGPSSDSGAGDAGTPAVASDDAGTPHEGGASTPVEDGGCSMVGTDGQTTSPAALALTGLDPTDYALGLDSTTPLNGASTMKLASAAGAGLATWAASGGLLSVDSTYAGKRYRMRAEVKTENAQAAWLWFRIDTPTAEVLANMQDPTYEPIVGTNDWQEVDLVLDVPAGAVDFAFGSGLVGTGTIWVGPITLEAVQTCVATSPNSGLESSM